MKVKNIEIVIEDEKEYEKRVASELKALEGGRKPKTRSSLSFLNLREYRQTLTEKRLELLHTIRTKRPKSIYELAKYLRRPAENVNREIHLLKRLGLVDIKRKITKKRELAEPVLNYGQLNIAIQI